MNPRAGTATPSELGKGTGADLVVVNRSRPLVRDLERMLRMAEHRELRLRRKIDLLRDQLDAERDLTDRLAAQLERFTIGRLCKGCGVGVNERTVGCKQCTYRHSARRSAARRNEQVAA